MQAVVASRPGKEPPLTLDPLQEDCRLLGPALLDAHGDCPPHPHVVCAKGIHRSHSPAAPLCTLCKLLLLVA